MDEVIPIDYVLVYESEEFSEERSHFESNLRKTGLILSTDEVELGLAHDKGFKGLVSTLRNQFKQDEEPVESRRKLHFVKIHAPNHLLEDYCERLKIKMPIKMRDCPMQFEERTCWKKFWRYLKCAQTIDWTRTLKCPFSKAKRHLQV
jgi:Dimerisation domain of Ca+-activated chloride-channel, anoctamin